jgi:cell wall-associated NlpC family hydrolase
MRSGAAVLAGALTLTAFVPLTASTAFADDVPTPSVAPQAAAVAPAKAARPDYRLKAGSKGKIVLRLERKLMIKKPDTYFDRRTATRVKQIERWGRIATDGVVDRRTEGVINKYVAKQRAAKAKAEKAKARKVNSRLAKIVKVARSYSGRPYARGAAGPRAFDCSGFTRYVVKKALGKSLPHQSGAQRGSVKKISRAQAKPGDLVFFHGRGGVYHVGIYAGKGKLLHASRPGTRSGLGPIFSSKISFGRIA